MALTNETLTQGDGGAKGIKTSTVTAANVTTNNAKNTNVTTDLSVTKTATTMTVVSSDGDNGVLVEADTTNAGILGSNKWDEIVANSLHRADNTQAHSDYLLNSGNDTTSGTITAAGFTTTGVTLTGNHGTAATDQVVNVCYGTSATPPTASTTTEGTIYVQYTA